MNKKPTILAVAALGSLALIGTGFAGWVIAANAETSAEGTITAYNVTDNRLVLSDDKWDENDNSDIRFGETENKVKFDNPWFTFANETNGTEKLTATYKAHIASKNKSDTGKVKATAKIEIATSDDAAKKAWDDAVTEKLVVNPKCEIKCGESVAQEGGDVLAEAGLDYTVKVQFAWGIHFTKEDKVVNPYNYYNSYTVKEKGDDAAKVLADLYKIGTTRFTLNLTFERVETK